MENLKKNKIVFSTIPLFIFLFILLFFSESVSGKNINNRETPVVKTVRKVSSAVVNISTEYSYKNYQNPFSKYGSRDHFDSFFNDFFDPYFKKYNKNTSLGSGVIIDGKRGYILTNAHVISKGADIKVILKDKREFKAKLIGSDPDSDLAVLYIKSKKKLPEIKMGRSDDIMIGETVIAIGNPFGFSNTVTTGVVSAINRSIKTENTIYHNFIQTDASINPGNSGGPLLNINGDLIGINTAIYAKAQGIGFAIPINKAKKIVSDLILYGEVIQPWTGLITQNLNNRLIQYLNYPDSKGIIVTEIEEKSPAQEGGFLEGDIIYSMDNQIINNKNDYENYLRNYSAGDYINLKIWRKSSKKSIKIKSIIYPEEFAEEFAYKNIGVKVKTNSKFEGVVITKLKRKSYLSQIGVTPGDVIRQIDDISITDKKSFIKAIAKYRNKNSIVILLQRGKQGYYITIKF